jgi:hypothetical protein
MTSVTSHLGEKEFEFNPEEENLKEATQEIINFLENPTPVAQKEKGKMNMDLGSTSTCNLVSKENKETSTT